jgi:flagellar basal-body rod protein FlgB
LVEAAKFAARNRQLLPLARHSAPAIPRSAQFHLHAPSAATNLDLREFPTAEIKCCRIPERPPERRLLTKTISRELRGQLMLPGLLASTNIPVLQQVVNFAEARHGVLAGNIVNINTPGYHTRDLNVGVFEQRLKEAIELSRKPGNSQPISAGMVTTNPEDELRKVSDSLTNLLYHDDTNIDLEQQVTEINKNNYLHNLALTVMTNQLQLLQTAISERV